MDRNNETIRLAKKAADAWRTTDTYHQAAQIIDMLISALEGDTTLTPPNEALALEELREMDGEPVFTIVAGPEPLKMWALVEVSEKFVWLTNSFGDRTEYTADVELESDGVAVYRWPPEGEEDT